MEETAPERWFVYILRCGDGTIYAGIAKDVAARLALHARGKGARYTRGRGPLSVAASAIAASKGDALRAENAWKKLPRASKDRILAERTFDAFVLTKGAQRSG